MNSEKIKDRLFILCSFPNFCMCVERLTGNNIKYESQK